MHSRRSRFIKKVFKTLRDIGVENGSRICIGVSGGPDSTGLLYALSAISNQEDFKIFGAYLDHGLRTRAEIEKEISFLKKCATDLKIELFIGRILSGEITNQARAEGRSIEELAREKRYEFFNSVKKKLNARYIATGHTLDDTIENVIMRFFQGSDISGLSGIPITHGTVIRPLSHCRKNEVLEYLSSIHVDYKIDSSNLDSHYLRNKTRHYLLPVIRTVFPGFEKNIEKTLKKATMLKSFIEHAYKDSAQWERIANGYRIKLIDFRAADPYMRLFSFLQMYDIMMREKHSKGAQRIPFGFIYGFLCIDEHDWKHSFLRGHGIQLAIDGEYLFCKADIVENEKKGYLITIEKNKKIALHGIARTIEAMVGSEERKTSLEIFSCNENLINYPIVLRSKRPGDKILIKGEHKTLKKIFNAWKVPEGKRFEIPVIEDRNRILFVMGEPYGYDNKCIDEIDIVDTSIEKNRNYLKILINND